MDEREPKNGRTIGSVKAVIYKYGGKINSEAVKKPQKGMSDPEQNRPSKAQELHLAKTRFSQINDNMEMAKTVKSHAELELLKAKKTVKELALHIEESKSKAKEQRKEIQNLNKSERDEALQTLAPIEVEDSQYVEMAREVEVVKRELSKIRLDLARALEEKSRAENEAEAASLRLESCVSSAEQLRREIEAANEEEVLVELAQIQARKELKVIETQRKEEAEKFLTLIEETRKKISVLSKEIELAKDLEDELAATNSDVEVLLIELTMIKEMDRRSESNAELKKSDLKSVTEDLEAAKNELESIKEGGFQLMSGMDKIRIELRSISEEKDRIKELEEKTEKSIKDLSSKLLRAKEKLELVSASEEQARSMLSSLSLALEKTETEKKAVKKEMELTRVETANIRTEIEKTESETDSTEDRLQVAMQELAKVKSAETKALKKLKAAVENVARARISKKKSTITISRFEHEYLTGCAVGARELAEKKVEAARAWSEALRASKEEMKINTAAAERKIKELFLKEEQEIKKLENSLNMERVPEGVLQSGRRQGSKSFEGKKSMRETSYNLTPIRPGRRSVGSPATTRRLSSSSSFTVKRRMVTLKVAQYFASKQIESDDGASSEDRD